MLVCINKLWHPYVLHESDPIRRVTFFIIFLSKKGAMKGDNQA